MTHEYTAYNHMPPSKHRWNPCIKMQRIRQHMFKFHTQKNSSMNNYTFLCVFHSRSYFLGPVDLWVYIYIYIYITYIYIYIYIYTNIHYICIYIYIYIYIIIIIIMIINTIIIIIMFRLFRGHRRRRPRHRGPQRRRGGRGGDASALPADVRVDGPPADVGADIRVDGSLGPGGLRRGLARGKPGGVGGRLAHVGPRSYFY